jgi:hypothetical protein
MEVPRIRISARYDGEKRHLIPVLAGKSVGEEAFVQGGYRQWLRFALRETAHQRLTMMLAKAGSRCSYLVAL